MEAVLNRLKQMTFDAGLGCGRPFKETFQLILSSGEWLPSNNAEFSSGEMMGVDLESLSCPWEVLCKPGARQLIGGTKVAVVRGTLPCRPYTQSWCRTWSPTVSALHRGKEPYRVGLTHKVGVERGALLCLPYTEFV
ncbi:hypothetical protein J6590_102093 [Homalodisca vitripennis]|nr:hypothetical protein J6590_102093 [Homalodisca vitripennis]